MNAYLIADDKWGVSKNGRPLVSIPQEEKSRLKEVAGTVLVYDIAYLDKMPGQQPLRDSVNLIYSPLGKKTIKGAKTFDSISELKAELKGYKTENINILNSAVLYKELYDLINVVHVTKLEYAYEADAYIDSLDKDSNFKLTADSDEQYCFDIVYNFLCYERV